MLPLDPSKSSPLMPSSQALADAGPAQYPLGLTESYPPLSPAHIGAPAQADGSGASFVQALRRRWLMGSFLGVMLAALAVAAVCWAVPPKYKASAQVHIAARPPRGIFSGQSEYMSSDELTAFMKTQSALLKSQQVLSSALRQPQVAELPEVSVQPDALAWLDRNTEIEPGVSSEILKITLSGDYPDDLANVLNAIVDAYLQQMSQKEDTERVARIQQLEENVRQYREDLRRSRDRLQQMQEGLGIDAQTGPVRYPIEVQRLGMQQTQLMQAKMDLNRTVKELAGLEEQERRHITVPVSDAAIDEYSRQDEIQKLHVQRLAQLEQLIQRIRTNVQPDRQEDHVKGYVKEKEIVQSAVDKRRNEIRPQVQAYLEHKAAEERASRIAKLKTDKVIFEDSIKAYDAEVTKQEALVNRFGLARAGEKTGSDVEALRDEVKQKDETLKKVADQIQLMKVEPRPPLRASLLEPAAPPRSKNYQLQIKFAGAAGFGAFALMLFGVTWREFSSRKIYSAGDVVENLGINLLGSLPDLPASTGIVAHDSNGHAQRDKAIVSEAVDALRAQLLRAADREGLRVIMITSANAGEGKTSLACQLAASLARAWRKTLLIDGDLRHPGVDRQLDMPLEPGFCDVLRGEVECDDAVRPTPISRLWMIPAGHCDEHATQALAQKEVHLLLERLKEQYDFIIVDSSPVLPVADALSLGQHVDAVVFSVLRDVSRLPAVQSAYQRMASLGIRMLGTVVLGGSGEAGNLRYPYPTRVG